jgi:hypothetical protein
MHEKYQNECCIYGDSRESTMAHITMPQQLKEQSVQHARISSNHMAAQRRCSDGEEIELTVKILFFLLFPPLIIQKSISPSDSRTN